MGPVSSTEPRGAHGLPVLGAVCSIHFMDLEFSSEQDLLRETVRGLCRKHAPYEVVRALEDDPDGCAEELWRQLGALGLTGLRIPEEYGGTDQGMLEAVVLYEELGRALAPTPHFSSAIVAAAALLGAGSDAQKREWLPRIATGDAVLAPAWLEPRGGFDPGGVRLAAEPVDGGFELSGIKHLVAFARGADRLVVLARTGVGDEEIDLFLVDPKATGVTLAQRRVMGSDARFEVRFDAVRVRADDRIGEAGSGWATWDAVAQDAAIVLAAQAMGGADRALEMTVAYAKERHQFGKPLGAFQALAHDMADASTRIDGGRTLVYEAAWARDAGRSVRRLAPMAKLFADQTFVQTTKMAQQIHGGMGFSVEYDIQLYFRRAKQLQISWWDSRTCEDRIAADVLDGDGPPDLRSAPA